MASGSEKRWLRVVDPPKRSSSIPPRLPRPDLDDSQLLASVRLGAPEAAAAVHDRLRPAVERAVRRLLGARDADREDLVQQSMIEIVTTIDRFRGECPLDAWARTVAAHVVYKQIRRRTTERRIFDVLHDIDDVPTSGAGLVRETTARSVLRRVVEHLEAMDPVKAWAYFLHDVCGHDLKEVATIMDTTVAASQSRLVRGRKELTERLDGDAELAPLLAKNNGGEFR